MKQFYQAAIIICCSLFSSACYLIPPEKSGVNSDALQLLPPIMGVTFLFIVVGVAFSLSNVNNERRNAALAIAGGATAVFLLLLA
jgi:hypothetical protein